MGQLIPFKYESKEIRVLPGEDGEPWFVASDVCDALGYANSRDAVQKHCKYPKILKSSESRLLEIPRRGITIIPESDVTG